MNTNHLNLDYNSLLRYDSKVGHLLQSVKITDSRRGLTAYDAGCLTRTLLSVFLGQFPSLNHFLVPSSLSGLYENRQNWLGSKADLPSQMTLARFAASQSPALLREALLQFSDNILSSGILKCPQVGGLTIAGIDGMESLCSSKKEFPSSLTRQHARDHSKDYFFRSIALVSVGVPLKLVLYEAMCEPALDSSSKDEGELTAGLRVLRHFFSNVRCPPDILVGDALYSVATMINAVLALYPDFGTSLVATLKGDNRHIVQDSVKKFRSGQGLVTEFERGKNDERHVVCHEDPAASVTNVKVPVRVLMFDEYAEGERVQTILSLTTSNTLTPQQVNYVQHARWDLEINAFRGLKNFFNADHCFVGSAAEQLLLYAIFAYDLLEHYLARHRGESIRQSGATRQQCIEEMARRVEHDPINWALAGNPVLSGGADFKKRPVILCSGAEPKKETALCTLAGDSILEPLSNLSFHLNDFLLLCSLPNKLPHPALPALPAPATSSARLLPEPEKDDSGSELLTPFIKTGVASMPAAPASSKTLVPSGSYESAGERQEKQSPARASFLTALRFQLTACYLTALLLPSIPAQWEAFPEYARKASGPVISYAHYFTPLWRHSAKIALLWDTS